MEPIFTFHGMTLAQPEYMQKLVAYVRSLGAVVIVDEVQGGLGRCERILVVLKSILMKFLHRTGTVWSYQHLGVTPDILVCSKPLSAGVPFAVVATRPELAQSLNQVGPFFLLSMFLFARLTTQLKLTHIQITEYQKCPIHDSQAVI